MYFSFTIKAITVETCECSSISLAPHCTTNLQTRVAHIRGIYSSNLKWIVQQNVLRSEDFQHRSNRCLDIIWDWNFRGQLRHLNTNYHNQRTHIPGCWLFRKTYKLLSKLWRGLGTVGGCSLSIKTSQDSRITRYGRERIHSKRYRQPRTRRIRYKRPESRGNRYRRQRFTTRIQGDLVGYVQRRFRVLEVDVFARVGQWLTTGPRNWRNFGVSDLLGLLHPWVTSLT